MVVEAHDDVAGGEADALGEAAMRKIGDDDAALGGVQAELLGER
jgi:hypothetical protein